MSTPTSFPINDIDDPIFEVNGKAAEYPASLSDFALNNEGFYELDGELCYDVANVELIGTISLTLQHGTDDPYQVVNIAWEPANELVGSRPRRRPHTT